MTFVWMDGFEIHAVAGYVERKYSCVGSPSGPNVGRLHGNSMNFTGSVATTPSLGVDTTFTVGFGCWSGTGNYVQWMLGGVAQFTLVINGSNLIEVRRGSQSGTVLATGTTVLPSSNWVYIEFKVTLSDAATGSYEVRVDTILEVSGTGVITAPAPGGAETFRISGFARFDDLYVLNNGAGAITFLGDTVIEALVPDGAGASTQWTPTGGSNFDVVSDPGGAPNDNDYVESNVINDKDYYTFSNLTFITGSIHAVTACMGSSIPTAGSRQIRAKFRNTSAAEGNFATQTVNGTTVMEYCAVLEADPASAAPWSIPELNGGQFGIEVVN